MSSVESAGSKFESEISSRLFLCSNGPRLIDELSRLGWVHRPPNTWRFRVGGSAPLSLSPLLLTLAQTLLGYDSHDFATREAIKSKMDIE
jgi:hypothetical protein